VSEASPVPKAVAVIPEHGVDAASPPICPTAEVPPELDLPLILEDGEPDGALAPTPADCVVPAAVLPSVAR
jgi:hypothetical protein